MGNDDLREHIPSCTGVQTCTRYVQHASRSLRQGGGSNVRSYKPRRSLPGTVHRIHEAVRDLRLRPRSQYPFNQSLRLLLQSSRLWTAIPTLSQPFSCFAVVILFMSAKPYISGLVAASLLSACLPYLFLCTKDVFWADIVCFNVSHYCWRIAGWGLLSPRVV